jgi:hypothetical protein
MITTHRTVNTTLVHIKYKGAKISHHSTGKTHGKRYEVAIRGSSRNDNNHPIVFSEKYFAQKCVVHICDTRLQVVEKRMKMIQEQQLQLRSFRSQADAKQVPFAHPENHSRRQTIASDHVDHFSLSNKINDAYQ